MCCTETKHFLYIIHIQDAQIFTANTKRIFYIVLSLSKFFRYKCICKFFHWSYQNRTDFKGTKFSQVFDVLEVSVSNWVQTEMKTYQVIVE